MIIVPEGYGRHSRLEIMDGMFTYIRLDSPVVVIVEQTILEGEETRVPAAHMMVTLQPGLADADVSHELTANIEASLVNPGWNLPVLRADAFEVALCTSCLGHLALEILRELLIIEEDPVVLMGLATIEASLDLGDALDHALKLRVTNKGNKGGLGSGGQGEMNILISQVIHVGVGVVTKPLDRARGLRLRTIANSHRELRHGRVILIDGLSINSGDLVHVLECNPDTAEDDKDQDAEEDELAKGNSASFPQSRTISNDNRCTQGEAGCCLPHAVCPFKPAGSISSSRSWLAVGSILRHETLKDVHVTNLLGRGLEQGTRVIPSLTTGRLAALISGRHLE